MLNEYTKVEQEQDLIHWMEYHKQSKPPDGYYWPLWWDGSPRFQYVNRNVISAIQRESFLKMIVMLAPGAEGWDMGGPGALVSLFDKKVQIKGLELENSNCLNADATCLPFKDNVLDFIVSFHAIEHFKDVRSAFKEWYRVLKPGGIVGFIMPDFEHFSHYNWEDKNSRFYAPSEMLPEQCLSIIKETKFNILSFNSMDNNFEFEGILKK